MPYNDLIKGFEFNPHSILGPHQGKLTLWRPGAEKIYVEVNGEFKEMKRIEPEGIFQLNGDFKNYKVYHSDGSLAEDPYAFLPTVGEVDLYLYGKGVHYQIYNILGAHLTKHQGVEGIKFAVWAPSAKSVSIVADFNYWDGRVNPMRSLGSSGVWEIFIPGLKEGIKYKFQITTQDNRVFLKSDPFALGSEVRSRNASIVREVNRFEWDDKTWMESRVKKANDPKPINIYEVHLESWKRGPNHFLNYREIAVLLADYILEMGYTHIELMPIFEHPLDESWGYQVTGFYAVTSRYGTPEDFQWFVNYLHKKGIGVLLDWVPGHFPVDDFSLNRFDGTALYEHEDPRQGFHPHWNTNIFNYSRHEVTNFLIGSALFWFDKMHIDGLRVDAVASMLYLDYGRAEGEWIANCCGGRENLDAIEFLKHLNSSVHRIFPGILIIAEESTAFPGVTKPVEQGGLGFDLKWNMGWMNDTLRYIKVDPLFRSYHQNELTFGLIYAFSEKFCLPLSHDEVVHSKGSLIGRMPGDMWQKFANLRLLLSYQMCQPGKKLLFMSGELAQWNEWDSKREIEWFLLEYPTHKGVHNMVKELNHFYLSNNALWERDFDYSGFSWIDFSDSKNCIISYLRISSKQQLLVIHNFTPQFFQNYFLPIKNVEMIHEAFNTDSSRFGGSNKLNENPEIKGSDGVEFHIAPLATQIFHIHFR
jgi:1,4-alpha-glucan branching enzyme